MAKDGNNRWTVLNLLDWTREHFDKAEVCDSRICAEVLLAHALGCKRIELYARYDQEPSAEQLNVFRQHVRRAAKHEPVAYLVGSKEFYSLSFNVTRDVLIPRPETEMLVSEALEYLKGADQGRLWDTCTGCGCVAIAAARQMKQLQALATDVSAEAVAVAEGNAASLDVSQRVRCRVADCLELPQGCDDLSPFDVITANPPYVSRDDLVAPSVDHEPEIALYAQDKGLAVLQRIVEQAPPHLRPDGALIMEFGCGQADDVRDLIVQSGHFGEPTIYSDYQDLERMVVAVRSD